MPFYSTNTSNYLHLTRYSKSIIVRLGFKLKQSENWYKNMLLVHG